MVTWVFKLLEYDISFLPRRNIMSQELADLMVEFSSPMELEVQYL